MAVECALALPLFVAVVMMVMHLALLCIQHQRVIYDADMALRSQKIVSDVAHAQQVTPDDNPVCGGGASC